MFNLENFFHFPSLKEYFQDCVIDFLPVSIFCACVPCTFIVINLKISNINIAVLWLLGRDLSFFIEIEQLFKI
tara:strand:+ start:761 stop:979 length:219 start_codon:yes stop_codon:yes gene_type:complete